MRVQEDELTSEAPETAAAPPVPEFAAAPAASIPESPSERPPVGEPPAGEPPADNPPAGEPPSAPPPAGDPPSGEPPASDPPAPGSPGGDAPMRAETAAPEPVGGSEGGQYLEELTTPLPTPASPVPLEEGAVLTSPSGQPYRIERHLRTEAGIQLYEATAGEERRIWIRAAAGDAAPRLQREADLLASLQAPLFPVLLERFEADGLLYLVTEPVEGPTLAETLSEGLPLARAVSVVAQAAHGLVRLHRAGWLHLGLRPDQIHLGRPVKAVSLAYATRIGERPPAPFYHAGYSPPELLAGEPLDERADVYGLGALLFHAVNGAPIAETGVELSTWEPPQPVGGIPQILERCLGPRDTRYSSVQQLHRDLLRLARRLAPPIRYQVAAATSIGLEPTRTTNQDAYVWLTGSVASEEGLQEWAVLCVSDGMGGMAAGEVASNAAVKRLAAEAGPAMAGFRTLTAEDQVRIVKEWMHAANDSATDAMEKLRVRGGATLVCACVVGRRLTLSHVGDCRIYLLRGGEIRQLNRDHSLVMALALQGQIRVEEIRNHPDRSTITRSLGDRRPLPQAHVDTLEQVTGSPVMEVEPGDVLLLCSDGLWEPVVEAQMQQAVEEAQGDLALAADRLVQLALDGGGPDNIAVMLFRLDLGSPAV